MRLTVRSLESSINNLEEFYLRVPMDIRLLRGPIGARKWKTSQLNNRWATGFVGSALSKRILAPPASLTASISNLEVAFGVGSLRVFTLCIDP